MGKIWLVAVSEKKDREVRSRGEGEQGRCCTCRVGHTVKKSYMDRGVCPRFDPRVGKIPWKREWLPTPGFLLRDFHGQRSLAGYSPCVAKSQTWLSNTKGKPKNCTELYIWYWIIRENKVSLRDFSNGPVVKTLCFYCRGWGFDPWLGK